MTVLPPPDPVIDDLLDSYRSPHPEVQHLGTNELPKIEQVARAVEMCRELLFPGFVGPSVARMPDSVLREQLRDRLAELRATMRRQVYRALHHKNQLKSGKDLAECPDCLARAEEVTEAFVSRLPAVREQVARDVRAALDGDPAATGPDEVVVCYPGVYAITTYRLAAELRRVGAVVVPRIMTEHAHEKTGIDIHPGATIGDYFFIDHGTGVVIGETSLIGDRVRIYQGVTLGAHSVPRGERVSPGARRHPTIEDDVVIYAGATILGGDTVIGKGAVIGGNAWVTTSVAPGAVVAGSVSRRDRKATE
jgi:serine O-acetyltransferase